jgi:threonine/homoserine/homoserine lactone efflux protein
MALMLRNVLRGGAGVVVPTAVGTCSGPLVWGAASSLGIAALLATSAELLLAHAPLRALGMASIAETDAFGGSVEFADCLDVPK